VFELAARWQAALRQENLHPGDRVAVMLKNCLEWVLFDLAALGLGLVTVPLFVKDRPENFAFILTETGAASCDRGIEQWRRIERPMPGYPASNGSDAGAGYPKSACIPPGRFCRCGSRRRRCMVRWSRRSWRPSSTLGHHRHAQGVMLSRQHPENAFAGCSGAIYPDDLFLPFSPSHFRTDGGSVPDMAGACVARIPSTSLAKTCCGQADCADFGAADFRTVHKK
jgi:long-chain acyl-CoA synthetase